MVKKIPEYLVYFLEDCLQGNSFITYKSMFWWYGIYKRGKIFALYCWPGEIYFKVDEVSKNDYINAGSEPFRYKKKWGGIWEMCYYLLPEDLLENKEELEIWIEKSLAVKSTTKKKSIKNTELDKKILKYLLDIPKGKVTSYKNLAIIFAVHPRKIASVMRYNKEPLIYPCYKVLADSGKISGYNTDRGIIEKIEKLENDGIKIIDGKVEKKYFV